MQTQDSGAPILAARDVVKGHGEDETFDRAKRPRTRQFRGYFVAEAHA